MLAGARDAMVEAALQRGRDDCRDSENLEDNAQEEMEEEVCEEVACKHSIGPPSQDEAEE